MSETLLELRNLRMDFVQRGGLFGRQKQILRAVDDVSLSVPRGKTLGLVGESGSGKTTIGKCILRLIEPTAGEIIYDGEDLRALDARQLRARRADMQMIYQSPA